MTEVSGLVQSSLASRPSPFFSNLKAFVPRRLPEKITVAPSTMGVDEFYDIRCDESNTVSQSVLPPSTLRATTRRLVMATRALIPPTSSRVGEAYAEPSSVHFHFSSPVARS